MIAVLVFFGVVAIAVMVCDYIYDRMKLKEIERECNGDKTVESEQNSD